MIVDTHAHLDMDDFSGDLGEVIARAAAAGVGRILTVGIDLESSLRAISIAEKFPSVWAAAGIHPHGASRWDETSSGTLTDMLTHRKVVAVGETGLDFYRNHSPREDQIRVFEKHLTLARQEGLPVIIHSREANPETLRVLKSAAPEHSGVMHCFSGDEEEARAFLEMGLKISIAGPVTYPAAGAARELVSALPVECLLVETDCPYLAPQSHRGKRNEPAMISGVVEKIAEIKGLSTGDVARITTDNARRLFDLGLEGKTGEIVYRIRRSLYLNITNRCSNECSFCGRQSLYRVKGHNLRLEREPSKEEVLEGIGRERDFDEVVFCGYGEPLLRLDLVKEISGTLKKRGHRIRVNTNGLASLTHGRSIPRELAGLVDAYSVSLNAPDAETYQAICRPIPGQGSFEALLEFIREAQLTTGDVTATAVGLPGVDLEACRRLASSLGVKFRIRHYNEVG